MPDSIEQVTKFFVGREEPLKRLHAAFDEVGPGKRLQFVLIGGQSGAGKTTLANKFIEEVLGVGSDVLVGRAKCSSDTAGNGLLPFGLLLRELTEQGLKRGVITGDLRRFVLDAAPAWLNLIPTVGGALSEFVKASVASFDPDRFLQGNSFEQFARALKRLGRKRVIVLLEDLHWADSSSLELLHYLVRNLDAGAVLFICTYRPDEVEAGPNVNLFHVILAEPAVAGAELKFVGDVDAADNDARRYSEGINVADYVALRYPQNHLPRELINRVQAQTGGFPLFVDQLFTAWEKTGVIHSIPRADGRLEWRIDAITPEALPIPPQVTVLLAQVLSRMTPDLAEVLRIAAVQGESFTPRAIASLRSVDEYAVLNSLVTLRENYALVQYQGEQQLDSTTKLHFYRFAHNFVLRYVYDQLDPAQRDYLHGGVGECLQKIYKDPSAIAGQLAQHFYKAGELPKAAQWACNAAVVEQSRGAWAAGEEWCRLGLKSLDEVPNG